MSNLPIIHEKGRFLRRTLLTQAAAAAWWDVPLYVRRTKRHGVGFELFHASPKHSSSTPMAKPRELDEKCS